MWKQESSVELVLGIVILVFALWETQWSGWIIVIAAILLVIHSLTSARKSSMEEMPMKSASRRKRR